MAENIEKIESDLVIGNDSYRRMTEEEFDRLGPGDKVVVSTEYDHRGHPSAYYGEVNSYPLIGGEIWVKVEDFAETYGPHGREVGKEYTEPRSKLFVWMFSLS